MDSLVVITVFVLIGALLSKIVISIADERRGKPSSGEWGIAEPSRPRTSNYAWASEGNSRTVDASRQLRPSDPDSIVDLQAQIAKLKESGRLILRQRDEARASVGEFSSRIAVLQQKLAESSVERATAGGEGRFRAVKAAFARMYHPDRIAHAGLERSLREQVFKEFWTEIEKIERS